ncbi:MAG: helix-turn-helix domain-containing protein [Halioglobus sp.]
MPKKVKRPTRAPQMLPEERRKQLLRAGVESFACKGIDGTKHADLARSCKVAVPTVFSYFNNRVELVNAILQEVGSSILKNVIEPAQALPDQSARLPATASFYIEYAGREPDYVKVWLMWSMHFAPDIQVQFRKFENRLISAMAEIIQPGSSNDDPNQDIHDRARVVIASSNFLAKMVFDGVSEERRALFAQHVMESVQEQ